MEETGRGGEEEEGRKRGGLGGQEGGRGGGRQMEKRRLSAAKVIPSWLLGVHCTIQVHSTVRTAQIPLLLRRPSAILAPGIGVSP